MNDSSLLAAPAKKIKSARNKVIHFKLLKVDQIDMLAWFHSKLLVLRNY
jgi:hypothetical protein